MFHSAISFSGTMMMGGDIWSDVIGQNTEFLELNCGDMGELDYGGSLNNNKCGDKSYEDLIKIVENKMPGIRQLVDICIKSF